MWVTVGGHGIVWPTGPTTNRFKHWPSTVVSSVWSGDLLVDCANLAKPMVSWSRTCWTNYGPRPPHIILIIHVMNAFRASQFFTTILLPCIVVSANRRRRNGVGKLWKHSSHEWSGWCEVAWGLCTMYYVNAVLCVALKCSSTCAAGMQYLVSFPDPLWEAERGSSVLSDISCHKGHHKECLNRIFKSRTYVSNALVHMDYHTTPFTKPRDHWKVCWDSQKQAVKQDFSLVQNMITCSMQI